MARVVAALVAKAEKVTRWPTSFERPLLCGIGEAHGFSDCFYTTDGTTVPLAFRPSFSPEAFFDRKSRYSLNALTTNDPKKLVINVVFGFPGSVHSAGVLRVRCPSTIPFTLMALSLVLVMQLSRPRYE
eukprot:Plantae.Rhodophyta-Rhodochaete_pulchella.ctg10237.p1 GENE.Plantae.Rhodophyta-Rhodochaete_pulchella.ctg10237~~Plantae.Rhodophyta-Rhodochaete_pulchella.ctg10237.p1  ORF type:complete len:129 (-),score=5.41 Plantae.Rhodophyta-Rhodochaete_pulchella.ctg10237:206-592(-)